MTLDLTVPAHWEDASLKAFVVNGDDVKVNSELSFTPSNYTRRRIPKPYADYRC